MIGFQKTETAVGHDNLNLSDIRKQEASVCVMTEQEMWTRYLVNTISGHSTTFLQGGGTNQHRCKTNSVT